MALRHHPGFSWGCLGSRVVPYSETPEIEGIISGANYKSISAMPQYERTSHEELRFADYVLHKGPCFHSHNQGSAFQKSSSLFGPRTSSVPSSRPSFGTGTAAKPPFGSTRTGFGGSTGNGFVDRDPKSSAFGTSTTNVFSATNNSGGGLRTSTFGFHSASLPEGASTSASKVSTTPFFGIPYSPGFGIPSTPVPWSSLSSNGSSLYGTSNNRVSTTFGFTFGPTSASGSSSSVFGVQTSIGSRDKTATRLQGSRIASYSATGVIEKGKMRDSFVKIQSVSAMPCYEDKSHEELRSEDYGLADKGGQTLRPFFRSSYLETSETPFIVFHKVPLSDQSSGQSPFQSLTSSDPNSSITKDASQPQQTAEKVATFSTNDFNKSSLASSGLTTWMQCTSQNINEQYNPSSNSSMQSSLVTTPFATSFPIDQSNAVTPIRHGISSLPVSNNLSSNRMKSIRIRHVSPRCPGLSTQKPNGRSSETKVPFFVDEENKPGPVFSFLPRENPGAWVDISSLSLHSPQHSNGDEVKDNSSSSQLDENSTSATQLPHQHEYEVAATTERREADIAALLPKLSDEEYYTEPSLGELAAKEMAEAGFCSHVKDFVVGRRGYGIIKFLGETDVRHLDVQSAVQINNREVIVYQDKNKPRVEQHLINKAAEITFLNVKCIDKKTGKQYVEGHQVERYKEKLMSKNQEQGLKFISYDPVEGEWKVRVQHF